MPQTNFWVPQGEEWMDAEIHRLVDHFQAEHRPISKFAALYMLARAGAEQFSISVERIPADRRAGAEYSTGENKKQSGTIQSRQTRKSSAVTPLKPRDD